MFTTRDSVGLQGLGQAQGPLAPGETSIPSSTVLDTTGGTYTVNSSGQILDSNGNVVTNPQILSSSQLANINTQNYTQGQLNPVATCPAGSTCSIISSIPDTTIYIAGGILAALVLVMSMSGGGGRRR
jgi:hypothetical protein